MTKSNQAMEYIRKCAFEGVEQVTPIDLMPIFGTFKESDDYLRIWGPQLRADVKRVIKQDGVHIAILNNTRG